jgi:hypothetical protein
MPTFLLCVTGKWIPKPFFSGCMHAIILSKRTYLLINHAGFSFNLSILNIKINDTCPQALIPGLHATLNDWWEAMLVGVDKRVKRSRSGRLLYVIWNVWKERNRRIFQGVRLTYLEVAHITHEDIRQRNLAFMEVTPVVAPND